MSGHSYPRFPTYAQENLQHLDEEQAREGVLRELFGDFDEGSLPGTMEQPEEWVSYIDGDGEQTYGSDDLWQELLNQPPITFEDTFDDIFNEAFDLLIQRQRKYGPDNIARQGMWGVLTRIADDKIARLRRAFNGRIAAGQIALDPVEEGESDDTFEDACLDLMNYAAILLALKRGQWGRPLAEEVE